MLSDQVTVPSFAAEMSNQRYRNVLLMPTTRQFLYISKKKHYTTSQTAYAQTVLVFGNALTSGLPR